MKVLNRLIRFFFLFLISSSIISAQEADSTLLTLDRIFSSGEFRSERFGQVRWLESGKGYTTLEDSKDNYGGEEIICYDPETGNREILVPAEKLIPPGDTLSLSIDDYLWSPDGRKLLIFTNTRRVWRANTRGDYWVLDLDSGKLSKLGGNARPSTLMFAKFSPDGEKVGYVRENNLYVENLVTCKIIRLTHDGSETVINGTFDWVYEEEFDCRDGFRWSPDSKWIACWQLDTEGVGVFYLINNTDSIYSEIIPVQYPKAGTTNSACRVGVVSAGGGKIRWMKLSGDPGNNYIARMDWAAVSEEILMQYLNRRQNTLQILMGDARTGDVRTLFTDTDSAWVDVVDDLEWLEDGKSFLWVSEMDGWRHIYHISRDGKAVLCLTPGDYDVIQILNCDEESGWIYFIASPDNPSDRYLFRCSISGNGPPERLTPLDQPGIHRYQISPDSRWAFHTYSSFGNPPVIELVRLPDHETVRMLVSNDILKEKVTSLKKGEQRFFRIRTDKGVLIDGYEMKPYNFDPEKKYPVLFFVYGEPWGQTVQNRWSGGYLWHLMLTQQGYIVMSVDNRGTPAPRGREWRKSIYKKIGILNAADQADAVRVIRQWDYVDSARIGIWGWSGGGTSTLNALFQYPNLYQTGMSVAPVPDERLYDTIYQERYMGLPDENPEVYKEGSPITYAHRLQGNLLVVHGTGDDNVHFQGTERLINELIKHNRHFTMMAYPNRSHGIYEGPGTERHLWELLTRYLKENLPAGPR